MVTAEELRGAAQRLAATGSDDAFAELEALVRERLTTQDDYFNASEVRCGC
jgi:hypothetical protein